MVYRNSAIAALAALTYLLWQLNELLRPTPEGAPWQGVVLVSLGLGALVTAVTLRYRITTVLALAVHGIALTWTVIQTTAPENVSTLLPTPATFVALQSQFSEAFRIIRSGVEPVTPVPGLVALVAILAWVLGALTVAGLKTRRPMLALVPPLAISVQFAVMNRSHTGPVGTAIFLAILVLALLAVNIDERSASVGRMAPRGSYAAGPVRVGPMGVLSLVVVMVFAVAATDRLDAAVPNSGVVTWRAASGLPGDVYGGVSYNPYIGIRQQLVAPTGIPILQATIEGIPADQVYFRLTTMENWDGSSFSAFDPDLRTFDQPWQERPSLRFTGDTTAISGTVTIGALRNEWFPAPYSVTSLSTTDVIGRSLRARAIDGSIVIPGGQTTYGGLEYQFTADVPQVDYAALATQANGEFSPVFKQAQEDGRDVGQPTLLTERIEAPDLEPFLDLGDEPDARVAALAREITANMTNDFEKSLALETWLRQLPYSTDIPLGGGANNLGDWLTDPNSPNYRTGYCEQFATGMAVMARSLGIPTRVVLGFAPGELIPGSTNTVIVTDAQAHAWVEVWLEPNGWTRFDPTPRTGVLPTAEAVSAELGFDISEYFDVEAPEVEASGGISPQIARDEQPNDAIPFIGGGGVDETSGFELPSWARNAGLGLFALLTLIGAVPLLKWRRRRSRSRRLALGDISAAWEEIVARLDDLGEPPRVGATPTEAAADVDPAMTPLATVYARSVYGSTATLDRADIATARESLQQASEILKTRHGRRRHLRALYRLSSLRRR